MILYASSEASASNIVPVIPLEDEVLFAAEFEFEPHFIWLELLLVLYITLVRNSLMKRFVFMYIWSSISIIIGNIHIPPSRMYHLKLNMIKNINFCH